MEVMVIKEHTKIFLKRNSDADFGVDGLSEEMYNIYKEDLMPKKKKKKAKKKKRKSKKKKKK